MWRHLMATNSNIPSFPSQLDPPRTRDSFHPELAGLQYKPLPLPPAMLDGQCDRARQPYIEWSSESEDGNGECICGWLD